MLKITYMLVILIYRSKEVCYDGEVGIGKNLHYL